MQSLLCFVSALCLSCCGIYVMLGGLGGLGGLGVLGIGPPSSQAPRYSRAFSRPLRLLLKRPATPEHSRALCAFFSSAPLLPSILAPSAPSSQAPRYSRSFSRPLRLLLKRPATPEHSRALCAFFSSAPLLPSILAPSAPSSQVPANQPFLQSTILQDRYLHYHPAASQPSRVNARGG